MLEATLISSLPAFANLVELDEGDFRMHTDSAGVTLLGCLWPEKWPGGRVRLPTNMTDIELSTDIRSLYERVALCC